MAIKVRCPNRECGRAMTVSDQFAGRTGKCPLCGSAVVVPMPGLLDIPEDPGFLDEEPASKKPTVPPVVAAEEVLDVVEAVEEAEEVEVVEGVEVVDDEPPPRRTGGTRSNKR